MVDCILNEFKFILERSLKNFQIFWNINTNFGGLKTNSGGKMTISGGTRLILVDND